MPVPETILPRTLGPLSFIFKTVNMLRIRCDMTSFTILSYLISFEGKLIATATSYNTHHLLVRNAEIVKKK